LLISLGELRPDYAIRSKSSQSVPPGDAAAGHEKPSCYQRLA
jgi:hypothetical protein